jgi:hypothetical protein
MLKLPISPNEYMIITPLTFTANTITITVKPH